MPVKREIIRQNVAIEVERTIPDMLWHGWTYRKIGRNWVVSGTITPRETKEQARAAAIALAK